ncbi:hypothetical protein AWJ14_18710 [Hoeflea olei]|uniref:Short-chain dehydrogenase n=2 Tax=Hoeflea olei TaxID=1480615 RepID=A0A1C1YYG5_9HYPH|nr:hypothetical protein AWJ14_18710 [Hoeflea olei]
MEEAMMQQKKIAVVIGGGNGIGAATVKVMAGRGWRVVAADIDADAARAVASEQADCMGIALDVTDAEAMTEAASRIEAELGPVSALVVSSGAFQESLPPHRMTDDAWSRVMQVNLDGTWQANRIFGTRMAERGAGSIVNIASVTGLFSSPLVAYGTSKAAVIGLTRNLSGEWGRSGVRVNSVSPGVTLVERILKHRRQGTRYYGGDFDTHAAMGRSVEPVEVAEAVEFLASDRASAITGIDLPVDCGWLTAAPWEMFGGCRPAVNAEAAK